MGMDTLGVMAGHVPVEEMVAQVRHLMASATVGVRQLTGPNTWMIEAVSNRGEAITVTTYLNSHASADYPELELPESTMVLAEYGPFSERLIETMLCARGGWLKLHDGAPWRPVPPAR